MSRWQGCEIRNFDPWKAADTSVREAIHRHRKGAKVEENGGNGAMEPAFVAKVWGETFRFFRVYVCTHVVLHIFA